MVAVYGRCGGAGEDSRAWVGGRGGDIGGRRRRGRVPAVSSETVRTLGRSGGPGGSVAVRDTDAVIPVRRNSRGVGARVGGSGGDTSRGRRRGRRGRVPAMSSETIRTLYPISGRVMVVFGMGAMRSTNAPVPIRR